jgi:hypothetical protein
MADMKNGGVANRPATAGRHPKQAHAAPRPGAQAKESLSQSLASLEAAATMQARMAEQADA